MILDGLKKIRGSSFEDALDILEKEKVWHKVRKGPARSDKYEHIKYFRDSTINVHIEDISKIYTALPAVNTLNESLFIRGFYEIQPGFDWSQLDGPTYFERGNLVERVRIDGIKSPKIQT